MISLSRSAASKAIELTEHQNRTVAAINSAVGDVRAMYITVAPGQEMIYQAKEAEAKDFVAQPTTPTDLTPYPFIAAEVGTTAPDAPSVAQVFLNLADQWRALGARLEQARIHFIDQVRAQTTISGVDGALANFKLTLEPYRK